MLKNLSEDHEEYQALVKARDAIELIVSRLNEQKRDIEDLEKVSQIVSKIKIDEVVLA